MTSREEVGQKLRMNITKQNLAKHILQLSKEGLEYLGAVIPPAVSHISPNTPPEVAAIFATSIKATCIKIIDKALDHLDEGADIREIDEDWRANYFDKCRLVHDDEMQTLWAKLLAGEVNKPGTYSKRTVNFVAEMDKREAELFTCLCGFVCEIKYDNNIDLVPLIFPYDDYPYQMSDVNLRHLENINLTRVDDFPHEITLNEFMEVNYYGENIRLSLPNNEISEYLKHFPTGHIQLTQIGKELYPISGSTKIDGLLDYVCSEVWGEYVKD